MERLSELIDDHRTLAIAGGVGIAAGAVWWLRRSNGYKKKPSGWEVGSGAVDRAAVKDTVR